MEHNFDKLIDRRDTGSWKWSEFGNDVLPMWIADMDFKAPPCVLEALHNAVDHGVFGYATPRKELVDIVVDRLEKFHNWKIRPEWIVWLPGLVTALNLVCGSVGQSGDEVIVPTPAYPPFFLAPGNEDRVGLNVHMVLKDGKWRLDYDAIRAAITPKTKVLLFCNPHNPTGRVYTREELEAVAAIAKEHDLVICSDEIHCDLVLDKDSEHISIATLSEEVAACTITLLAPSKTYNVAGLGCSFAVIPDSKLRAAFGPPMDGQVPHVNALGFVATEAAYKDGESWRQSLLEYLRENLEIVQEAISEIHGLSMVAPEATYLAWIDCSELGLKNPSKHFLNNGLGLGYGRFFGESQYVRLNFACPRETLLEGLRRLKRAVEMLQ